MSRVPKRSGSTIKKADRDNITIFRLKGNSLRISHNRLACYPEMEYATTRGRREPFHLVVIAYKS